VPTLASRLWDRVYSDFLMRSRLSEYEELLESSLRAGYRISSVGGYWRRINDGAFDPQERHLVLRHDIDTDPGTAAAMWAIDRRLGVESSHFFPLSTLAPALMAEIAGGGSEVSYHYEEFSTVAKRRRFRTAKDALAAVPEAQDLFAANLGRLRATTGLPMRVVASHGDFVNRRLRISNWVILADRDFRRDVGIDLETYDEDFLRHLPSRHSDAEYPLHWDYHDPAEAIRAGTPVVYVLVHPRHWRADRRANARDDFRRVVEGLRFELPPRPQRKA
jgi:hypothetical protein